MTKLTNLNRDLSDKCLDPSIASVTPLIVYKGYDAQEDQEKCETQIQAKEQVRSMKAGKKSYYTVLDVYVGEHSKKRLIISSNVSHKFHNKKFTQFRG